jgi:glutamate synthase domain-containing protein 2
MLDILEAAKLAIDYIGNKTREEFFGDLQCQDAVIRRLEIIGEVDRLRDLGFKRVTLKTGAYSMVEAAMALKYCSEAKIDLLTCDGAPGGTGMSPWPMMEEWGIPTFYFQSLMYEFAEKLSKKGMRVPDLAMAGGFSS